MSAAGRRSMVVYFHKQGLNTPTPHYFVFSTTNLTEPVVGTRLTLAQVNELISRGINVTIKNGS